MRKAGVQAKRILLDQIKSLISRRSGRISDTYGKTSTEYTEFFPQGITPYREMNEAEVESKLQVIIDAGRKYDRAMEDEFTTLRTSWLAAKQAAGDKIAQASTADLTQDQALRALELTLMKVIFTAALTFTAQPEMGPVLFDQSKLENPGTGSNNPPAAPSPPA